MNILGKTVSDLYRVDDYINSGKMGVLFRVWDIKRNTHLAMKVLHPDLAEDPTILKSFQREAIALQQLTHQNIVPFYGFQSTREYKYLLLAYISGPSLKALLSRLLAPEDDLSLFPVVV